MKSIKLLAVFATVSALALSAGAAMAEGAKIFVIGGKADDSFWSIVKRGADDAGMEPGGDISMPCSFRQRRAASLRVSSRGRIRPSRGRGPITQACQSSHRLKA